MDSVVVITAAGKGMGAGCAESFSKAGYKVVLMSRSNDAVELASKLGGIGMQGSVLEEDDLQSLADLAMEHYGRIDVVLNNTGHPSKGKLLDLSIDDWQNGGNLVLMNVIKMSKIVTPVMKKQGGGTFINISTFAAFEPSLSFPISSVMRTALASFSKLYAQEYGADNIRMNNILPGYIESYPVTEEIKSQIPLARAGKVHEIGETAVFLASDGAAYITGENIKVDGGITKNI